MRLTILTMMATALMARAVPSFAERNAPPAVISPVPSGSADHVSSGNAVQKYVAYWSIWHAPTKLPTAKQLKGVTHLIFSFVDMGSGEPPYTPVWAAGAEQFSAATIKAIQAQGIKVMIAVGGWNLDGAFRPGARTVENRNAFATSLMGFVKQYDFDGIDLDWEYPVWGGENYKQDKNQFPLTARPRDDTDGPNFVLLAQEIRKQLDAYGTSVSRPMTMSIAVPSKYEDTWAYQVPETVKGLDKVVDFWNLIYDFMNRRNNATTHQAGGTVISDTIAIYKDKFNIASERLLFGIPMYAKWFNINPGCQAPYMGCEGEVWEDPVTGADKESSGWVTFNTNVTANAEAVRLWEAVDQNAHRDTQNAASAYADESRFWSWMNKDDVLNACKANIGKVGGVFIWSINQDNRESDGGEHIDAIQACLGV